ncbi:MalM family protein [Agarivorans sp. Alg241-V36]|uniref:MalM family protein n=1 Tax=Agarivorans sp. Alg241-V36 TaxID=2305992 RepID=UPI0013D4CE2B|nr:MalM family protein [Agarivorans sp. Alg241-V36]
MNILTKKIKKHTTFIFIVSALISPSSLAEVLQQKPVSLPFNEIVDVSSNPSQNKVADSNLSYEIPPNSGPVKMTIATFIDKTIFVPNIAVLDEHDSIVAEYTSKDLTYVSMQPSDKDKLTGEFIINPLAKNNAMKVVIYTTQQDIEGFTETYPAYRKFLESAAFSDIKIPNEKVPHSNQGTLEINFESAYN